MQRPVIALVGGAKVSSKIEHAPKGPLNFQNLILTLQKFWADQGCVMLQPYDMEMGAGTFHTATTLRALGPKPWYAAYVQPSRRPKDGRYGENPNRLQHYYQFQAILKPSPPDILERYLGSLDAIGIDTSLHDIRFVEDDWESPTLGAWGLGWEVWCDGMEITQFTYFQQVGGIEVDLVSGEITYGLERLCMYLQGVDNVFKLKYNDTVTYGDTHQGYAATGFQWIDGYARGAAIINRGRARGFSIFAAVGVGVGPLPVIGFGGARGLTKRAPSRVRVFGRSGTKRRNFGRAIAPICCATCERSSWANSSLASTPFLRITNAKIACPVSGSFLPTTAASATLWWSTSADSTSIVLIRCADTFITSSTRPRSQKYPSSSRRAPSPAKYEPGNRLQ